MTVDSMERVIALECGWTQVPCGCGCGAMLWRHTEWSSCISRPHAYCADSNGMAVALSRLKPEERRDYEINLCRVLGLPIEETPYRGPLWPVIDAKPIHHAEAFIKTRCPEKWEED